MSTALVPVQDLQPLAATLARSSLIPERLRGKEADVFVIILAGRELGLAPMTSLRSLSIIDGKPVIGSDAMVGIAQASGFCEYFKQVESTDKIATYETKRKGCEPVRLSFSFEEAKLAGLTGKQNWKTYPAAMLRARAKAALARDVYPDALAGVFDTDEATDFTKVTPPAPEVIAPEVEIDELEWQLRISAANSKEELDDMKPAFDELPNGAARLRIAGMLKKRRTDLSRTYAAEMKEGAK